jgi:TP901 family phage tail tape measure protein
MALNSLGLGFVFTARNLASGTIGRLRGQIRGLKGESAASGRAVRAGFGIAAAGIAPLVVGVAGVATALNLAKASAEFEVGVQRVANISGATAAELQQLRDAAIEAGLRTQFSPDEATQGLAALAAQGFNARQSMDLLNDSLNLAAGGQIGIEEATRSAAAAVRVFNIQGDEQRTIADRLLKITNMTGLQAGDLALALGTVSRGAGLAKQDLNEMLIAMGLVRNAGIDTSVAASSVSSALQFAAKNAGDFSSELGVAITENGEFRDFLDIVTESSAALEKKFPDAAERVAAASKLFGRFGVTAFQNVSAQIQAMVGTEPGINTVADAVASLREEMAGASGTAREFADNLLDTFAGQSKILEGAGQTLVVVLGEPFARVFKPIVKIIAQATSEIARLFDSLPKDVQTGVAAFVVFASVVSIATGALLILSGLAVVIAPFFVVMLKVFLAITAALIPLILGMAVFGGAVALVVAAVNRNLGGLGDLFGEFAEKTQLAWRALTQLFEQGGFSGAVLEEMQKAENSGVRSFVLAIFGLGFRLRQFWEGFSTAFEAAFIELGPAFMGLREAFVDLGEALGFVGFQGDKAVAGIPSSRFAEAGAEIATTLARVLRGIVAGITATVEVVTGFVEGVQEGFSFFSPVFSAVGALFTDLGEQIRELFLILGISTGEGVSGWRVFGLVVGTVVSAIATVVAFQLGLVVGAIDIVVRSIAFLVSAWREVSDTFSAIGIRIRQAFLDVVDHIVIAANRVLVSVSEMAEAIPESVRPQVVQDLVDVRVAARANIAGSRRSIRQRGNVADSAVADIEGRSLARGEAEGRARGADVALVHDTVAEVERRRRAEPVRVELRVDGEVLAQATARAERREGARGFVPVPAAVE